ncbi:MAG TPA: hypothetical protein VJU16_02045 [Planctomycetota bacterium]|nr:hypothetical protein [Planctomycetota bacterium]
MKRICFSPLLLLLNGCFSCGTGSHVQPVDPGLKLYQPSVPALGDRHGSSRLDRVAPGDWVRYRLSINDSETTITLGAVRVEGNALWVEVVDEGEPKKASLRKIEFDGRVTSARFREVPASGPPSETADQPVSPTSEMETAPGTSASSKEEKRSLSVGARSVEAVVYRRVFRDESVGREHAVEEAWSKDVPPLFEDLEIDEAVTGLVHRKSPSSSIALVEWGTGYTPLIK